MNASLSNVVGIVVNRRILAALSLLLGRGREREEGEKEEERNLWARNLYAPRYARGYWYSKSSIFGRIIFNSRPLREVTVFGLDFFMRKR